MIGILRSDGEWLLWISFAVPTMYLCNFTENFVIRVLYNSCKTCWGMPRRGGDQGKTVPDVPGTVNLNFISVLSMARASLLASSWQQKQHFLAIPVTPFNSCKVIAMNGAPKWLLVPIEVCNKFHQSLVNRSRISCRWPSVAWAPLPGRRLKPLSYFGGRGVPTMKSLGTMSAWKILRRVVYEIAYSQAASVFRYRKAYCPGCSWSSANVISTSSSPSASSFPTKNESFVEWD